MSLDYTKGCVNFRDVGEWINEISCKKLLPTERIFRGGKINFIKSSDEIKNPGSIINLRKGPDPKYNMFGADYFHFPISNDYEKYNTDNNEVRKWLNIIFICLEKDVTKYPILFHCTSGKDRTGVVVASLLKLLEINEELIIEEYLLSEGDVKKDWIISALEGLKPIESYFKRINIDTLRKNILSD
jgi:protein-tyrosine phosphatase